MITLTAKPDYLLLEVGASIEYKFIDESTSYYSKERRLGSEGLLTIVQNILSYGNVEFRVQTADTCYQHNAGGQGNLTLYNPEATKVFELSTDTISDEDYASYHITLLEVSDDIQS